MCPNGRRIALVLALAALAHGRFNFPEGCVRSQFAQVPVKYRCVCANATRISSIDLLTLHHCHMEAFPAISIALLVTLLCLMFYAVADTTDRFTVPAVTYISKTTRLDPSVAGATLLAFANGMPDLISCVASFSGTSKHTGFGVGSLLGSGLVISCFTLGYLAFLSNGFPVQKRPFIRDIIFYLLALLGLLTVYRIGYVSIISASIALCLYGFYAISVVWMHDTPPSTPKPLDTPSLSDSEASNNDCEIQVNTSPHAEVLHQSSLSQKYVEVALDSPFTTSDEEKSQVDTPTECDDGSLFDEPLSPTMNDSNPRTFPEYLNAITGWRMASLSGKFLIVALFPFYVARYTTVPTLNDNHTLVRMDVVTWAFWTPMFCMFVISSRLLVLNWSLVVATSILSTGLALAAWKFCTNSWYFTCSIVTLLVSAMWVFLIGHEIVAAMHVIGVSLGISGSTLGILVLAWGNSIGDFVGNAALARQGQVQMATAACIAGPIFNTLIGGGFSLLLGCLRSREHTVPLWSATDKTTLRSGFFILGLTLLSLLLLSCRFTLHVSVTKWFGVFLMLLYTCFCMFTLVEETIHR